MSVCAQCGLENEDVRIIEHFNCFAVALCTQHYSELVQHYFQSEDFKIYRALILKLRTLEAWMASNPRTEDTMHELIGIDQCIVVMELKLASMLKLYLRARS